ncbi:GDSL-type esterase/lipase family protein [Nocardia sp. NPDC004068]|uniref:GDSL-type esterase/lipase family protein n=1 Tax=Nocardia sp. NPDC004068 TaxID=3364303 RepID=UPI0036C565F7
MSSTWLAGFRSAVISPYERIQLQASRGFADETVRQVLRLVGGGARVRVRLSNRYGTEPLVVAAARVALRKAGAEIVGETERVVRFDGADQVTIQAGDEIVSDAIDLAVEAGDDLVLSLYLPEATGLATFTHSAFERAYIAPGDRVAAPDLAEAEESTSRFFVTGVDVLAPAAAPVVVAFGDSWFEGAGTTVGANHRSVDFLNARLREGWIVNQGIGGNRLLTDEVGAHGLARFERDVLAVPGVTHVLANFGINDLILDGTASIRDLIDGYTELARRAHAAGLPIYANTVGPFAGVVYPGLSVDTGIPARHEINEWLRGTTVFDRVFDVAAAVASPDDPDLIRPDLDSGDGLHLNDEGARIMAAAMDFPLVR